METIQARHVILGAGVVGTAAAYHLAKRGEPFLLIDQFNAAHDRGSSHGATRIIRHSYADPFYACLMLHAYRLWCELEVEAGVPLLTRTGGISVSPPGLDYVARVGKSLQTVAVPHRRMNGKTWCGRNPSFTFQPDVDVVFEPDAGILHARRALGSMLDLAARPMTLYLPETRVRRIDFETTRPTLIADHLRIEAKQLIVTAGAWTGSLVPRLRDTLRPTRQQVLYFATDDPLLAPGHLPIFISMGAGEDNAFYGMPDLDGRGVKVARQSGPPVDPGRAKATIDLAYVARVREFLHEFLPRLADAPIVDSETCLYTMAPDEEFLVGPMPGRPDILIASPCSGHGFKFAILVGQVLADLATVVSPLAGTERWAAALTSRFAP